MPTHVLIRQHQQTAELCHQAIDAQHATSGRDTLYHETRLLTPCSVRELDTLQSQCLLAALFIRQLMRQLKHDSHLDGVTSNGQVDTRLAQRIEDVE